MLSDAASWTGSMLGAAASWAAFSTTVWAASAVGVADDAEVGVPQFGQNAELSGTSAPHCEQYMVFPSLFDKCGAT